MAFLKFNMFFNFFKGHNRSVKAKQNIVFLFFIKGYSILVSLLLVPISLDLLGNYKYGVWLTLFNLLSMIQIFDIGIGNGLRNKFTESISKSDFVSAREFVTTAYVLMSFISFSIIILFIYPWLSLDWSYVFNLDRGLAHEITNLIGFTILFTSIQFTLKLLSTILTALHKPNISALIFAISNTVTLLLLYILKDFIVGSLIIIGFIYSFIPIVVLTISSLILFNGTLKKYMPRLRFFKKNKVKDLLVLGTQFFIIQIAVLVIFQTDSLIISHVLSPEEVTPYNIVFKYYSVLTIVATTIMTPFWSAYTEANTQKDFKWIKNALIVQIKLLFPLIIAILTMSIISNDIFDIWLNKKLNTSLILIYGMALYTFISIWNNIYSSFLNGIGHTKIQMITSIFGTIINIPLSIYFANIYGSGGVILATIISLLFFSIVGPLETLKYFKKIDG